MPITNSNRMVTKAKTKVPTGETKSIASSKTLHDHNQETEEALTRKYPNLVVETTAARIQKTGVHKWYE